MKRLIPLSNDLTYIGIDDTDNLETRGTGFRARQLIERLQENNLAGGIAVTRHQLLVDDRVPYTSHNSSACLVVKRHDGVDDDQLMDFCRAFLLETAAEGSDAGLCLATHVQASNVIDFGRKAQVDVVGQDEARSTARKHGIRLEGLTGNQQGIIGSLSAVGLHVQGNDGRYLWPRGLRQYAGQRLTVSDLKRDAGIEKVSLLGGAEIEDETALINLGDWPRAVRVDNHAVLLVEHDEARHEYKVLDKAVIKSVRP
jgi:hypothetical protein